MSAIVPRVFVSAVSSEFADFRRVIAEELQKQSIDVRTQELFVGSPRGLTEFLRHEIGSSDAVICLVGSAYGAAAEVSLGRGRRSYTQLEYDFALQSGKPMFVFVPSPGCLGRLQPKEPSELLELQKLHHKEVTELHRHKYQQLDSPGQLRTLIAEITGQIIASANSDPSDVALTFPTPLAKTFAIESAALRTTGGELRPAPIQRLFNETIRFLSLIALQDSLLSQSFGVGRADSEDALARLTQRRQRAEDWYEILRMSCDAASAATVDRAIPELVGWEQDHCSDLEEFLEWIDCPDDDELPHLWHKLQGIFRDLQFLKRYLLIASEDPGAETMQPFVLRGSPLDRQPRCEGDSDDQLRFLALIHPSRRRVLPLFPWFYWSVSDRVAMDWDVLGLRAFHIQNGDVIESKYAPFVDSRRIKTWDHATCSTHYVTDILSNLLKDFASSMLRLRESTQSLDLLQREFPSDKLAWEDLEAATIDADSADLIAGRLGVKSTIFHSNDRVDLFLAKDARSEDEREVVIHCLHEDAANNPTHRSWYESRHENWKRLSQLHGLRSTVLAPLELEVEDSEVSSPTTVVEHLAGAVDYERLVRNSGPLSDAEIIDLLSLAADVVEAANRLGLRVITLPLRHFLREADGNVRLTGFDTLTDSRRDCELKRAVPASHWREFTNDRMSLAPELRRGSCRLAETVDVFALGAFVRAARGFPVHPLDHFAPDGDSIDFLDIVEFHCLAEDPNLRFRTARHLKHLLLHFGANDLTPPVFQLETRDGDRPGNTGAINLLVAKFPVTNRQYDAFCNRTEHRRPFRGERVLHQGGETKVLRHGLGRFSAPWLPVTGVDLDDARAYCSWLSHETGTRWRLPTENEWQAIATGCEVGESQLHVLSNRGISVNASNHLRGPSVVGGFPSADSPNGCCDVLGNVWEWCDGFDASKLPRRILKGGSWEHGPQSLRPGARRLVIRGYRSLDTGFRVVQELKGGT